MIGEKIFNGPFIISDDGNSLGELILNSERFRMISLKDITNTNINFYRKVKQNGNNLLENFLVNKNIEVELLIKGKNSEDLRKNLNELRKVLFDGTKILKINYLGEYRFLDVLCESNDLNFEHYNTYWLKTSIRLVSLLPYWSSGILERENFSGNQNIFERKILNKGTAESEVKIFIYLSLNNGTSEVSLKINEKELIFNISGTERIEIDTKKFIVKVGNSEVEWKGEFNKLKPGENNIIFKRKNGNFHFNLDILYEKNYV